MEKLLAAPPRDPASQLPKPPRPISITYPFSADEMLREHVRLLAWRLCWLLLLRAHGLVLGWPAMVDMGRLAVTWVWPQPVWRHACAGATKPCLDQCPPLRRMPLAVPLSLGGGPQWAQSGRSGLSGRLCCL